MGCRPALLARRGTTGLLAPLTVGMLLAAGAPVAAQHEPFAEALVEFTTALSGTYGDEGAEVRGALDRLSRELDGWDRTLREYEGNVATALPTASHARALDMHTTMGALYVPRGRLMDAMREFDAAIRLAPDRPLLHIFRGLVSQAAGRPDEALEAFHSGWRLDPGDPITAYMVADRSLQSSLSPPPAALAALSAAVDRILDGQSPRPDPFIVTALLGDDVTASPLFVPALYADAYALIERAQYREAIDALRTASSRDPLLAERSDVMVRGSAALREGRVADAVALFTEATRNAPGSEAHRMLGMAYWLAADHERSIDSLQEAIRLSPMEERARLMLARVLLEIERFEQAEQLLVETVAVLPSSSMAHWRLGRLYLSAHRTTDALGAYERAVASGLLTGKGLLLADIGDLYRGEVRHDLAADAYLRLLGYRPNHAAAHRERGRALLQLEQQDAAFTELAAALLVDPEDHQAYMTIGLLYTDQGRYADAVRVLERAVAVEPDAAQARYAVAAALIRSQRRDESAIHLEAFQRLEAQERDERRRRIELSVLRLEAAIRAEEGAFARSAELWKQILETEPDVAANHAGLAGALAGLGQLEAAVAQYERALTLEARANVYRELAALYDKMGRADDSARTRVRLAQAQQDALGLLEAEGP